MNSQPTTNEAKPGEAAAHAIEIAKKRWERKNRPDDFHTRVTANLNGYKQTLKIRIQHHETYPMGGQAFKADVRKPPYGPNDLLLRESIHHTP